MNTESNENNTPVDDRTSEQKAPRKGTSSEKGEAKEPKAPAKPKFDPAEAYVEFDGESVSAATAVGIMQAFAETGEKKVLAYFAREAIACRTRGKEVRESLINED